MFTWVVAAKGTQRLAMVYLVIAAVALVLAVGLFAADAQHGTAAQETLELHITRYGG